MKKLFVLIFFIIACAFPTSAQLTKASVKDLAFMAGKWTLNHQWGNMEENWSNPMGDNLVSTFRCVKDGKVVFYEFMVIEQTGDIPVLKLRHFNKGSIGWEDKDKPYLMPAISLAKDSVVFFSLDKKVRITYKRLSPARLDCILNEMDKDGKWKQDVFAFNLSK